MIPDFSGYIYDSNFSTGTPEAPMVISKDWMIGIEDMAILESNRPIVRSQTCRRHDEREEFGADTLSPYLRSSSSSVP
jgi:hypothetical protein